MMIPPLLGNPNSKQAYFKQNWLKIPLILSLSGRKEIWDALKAAAIALESKDYTLAQAIIDGANICLPHGKNFLLRML